MLRITDNAVEQVRSKLTYLHVKLSKFSLHVQNETSFTLNTANRGAVEADVSSNPITCCFLLVQKSASLSKQVHNLHGECW